MPVDYFSARASKKLYPFMGRPNKKIRKVEKHPLLSGHPDCPTHPKTAHSTPAKHANRPHPPSKTQPHPATEMILAHIITRPGSRSPLIAPSAHAAPCHAESRTAFKALVCPCCHFLFALPPGVQVMMLIQTLDVECDAFGD